jgi:protein-L-isoaspartate(D-aspartate) O-methyltransferase
MSHHTRTCIGLAALWLLAALAPAAWCEDQERYTGLRHAMVRDLERYARSVGDEIEQPELDPRVLAALGRVPRHLFVPEAERADAYENRPLGIGHGQTISQPYIVALMTDLLEIEPNDIVLEIGTGSGYQAAVLAELAERVYTVEIIEPLARSARKRLRELGYHNITARTGDGYYGWQAHAPFDAIIVTAAASAIPPPLIQQLKAGGRMVIPVGSAFFTQQLMLVEKAQDGTVTTRQILPVRFVPLTRGH